MHSISLLFAAAGLLASSSSAQFVFFGNGQPGSSGSTFRQPSTFNFNRPSFAAPQPFRGSFQPQAPRGSRFFTEPAPSPVAAQPQPNSVAEPAAAAPKGNYEFEGRSYLLTWRTGERKLDWSSAVSYCKSKGMSLISLDSSAKADHFLRLVASDRAPYFWTGGALSPDDRTITWQNGKSESVQRGQHPWSFTGRTGPQPDGGERCVAVLNNTYNDGAKFHDVACHHTKPVICEA